MASKEDDDDQPIYISTGSVGLQKVDSISSTKLSCSNSQVLRASVDRHQELHKKEAHDRRHATGDDAPKKPSIISAVVSGFVNYLLMFGCCCAYGVIMFTDDFNRQHRALGVKLNLLTAVMAGLWCAGFSKIPIAKGGPDLNPVVFLGAFVNELSEGIASNVGFNDFPGAEGRRLMQNSTSFIPSRRLGGGGSGGVVDWCTEGGSHIKYHEAECLEYHESLRATILWSVMFSSAALGVLYFGLGRYKITRFVSYVPTSVQEAFLSCIGYKVFKYALLLTNYQPLQFIPAAGIGVTLYFLIAMRVGNPAVLIPVLVLVPLGIFHVVVAIAGLDIDSMRTTGTTDNWMFPELSHCDFWELWTDSYGKVFKIDFKAWSKTLPDFASMIVVCVIDCLLKISSVESKLPVKVNKDYEAKLHGVGNFLTAITASSVGYMQMKFVVIDYGIIGNVTDRRSGVVYAILCGVCFFGPIGHFNYLPRFFLGILLFWSGSGFVAENLWGSRKYLSFAEWSEILIILAVFIFSGSLVAAVIAGVLLTCLSMILKYSKISCIAGRPLKGGQINSCVRSNPLLERQLRHFGNSWFVVIRLKGFVFFASAQSMVAQVMNIIEERVDLPAYQHLRYVILDCELLDGMDASAGKSIRKMCVDANKAGCKLLWSHANTALARDLLNKEMIENINFAFHRLDAAILYIEYAIMEYQKHVQAKWLEVDMVFKLQHNLARFEHEQDPWSTVLTKSTSRRGCPWKYCDQVALEQCITVLWGPGEPEHGLFLIHSGRVALFSEMPSEDGKDGTWSSPVAVYSHGWFLNREFVIGMPTRYHAVAIDEGEALRWNRDQWWLMFAERPAMVAEIWRAVASQQTLDAERIQTLLDIGSMHKEVFFEEAEEEVAEQKVADSGSDAAENLKEDIGEMNVSNASEKAADAVRAYDDSQKANLPDQLRTIIDTFEVADSFGAYGAFLTNYDGLDSLPPLPNSIREDLHTAFYTYSVIRNGALVIPADQTMAALAYAGMPKAALRHSDMEFFTKAEFVRLGHEASMARMPVDLVLRLQDLVKQSKKKEGWQNGLDANQISAILRTHFHCSLKPEVVDGLLDELGPHNQSDETIFVSICSRLLKWHEQYYVFLVALRSAARLNPEDDLTSINKFTAKALAKKMSMKQDEVKENYIQAGVGDALRMLVMSDETLKSVAFGAWAKLIRKEEKVDSELASEMLWACNWPRHHESSSKFDGFRHIYDVALFVLMQIEPPLGQMHPPPVLEAPATGGFFKTKDGDESGNVGDLMLKFSSTASGIYQDFSQLTVEFPFHTMKVNLEALHDDLCSYDDFSDASEVIPFKELPFKVRVHLTMEEPTSSIYAYWTANLMAVFIMTSVFSLFLRPIIEHGRDEDDVSQIEEDIWFGFEAVLTGVFTLEYVIRVSVANALGTQTTCKYIISPQNICDLAAIMPFYIELILGGFAQAFRLGKVVRVIRVIRLLRLARVARVARLAKRTEVFAPIAMCLLVIWGIYMKSGLSDSK